jgi:hypothetical protein
LRVEHRLLHDLHALWIRDCLLHLEDVGARAEGDLACAAQ